MQTFLQRLCVFLGPGRPYRTVRRVHSLSLLSFRTREKKKIEIQRSKQVPPAGGVRREIIKFTTSGRLHRLTPFVCRTATRERSVIGLMLCTRRPKPDSIRPEGQVVFLHFRHPSRPFPAMHDYLCRCIHIICRCCGCCCSVRRMFDIAPCSAN